MAATDQDFRARLADIVETATGVGSRMLCITYELESKPNPSTSRQQCQAGFLTAIQPLEKAAWCEPSSLLRQDDLWSSEIFHLTGRPADPLPTMISTNIEWQSQRFKFPPMRQDIHCDVLTAQLGMAILLLGMLWLAP